MGLSNGRFSRFGEGELPRGLQVDLIVNDRRPIVAFQEQQQWRLCTRHPRQLEKVFFHAKAFAQRQVVI